MILSPSIHIYINIMNQQTDTIYGKEYENRLGSQQEHTYSISVPFKCATCFFFQNLLNLLWLWAPQFIYVRTQYTKRSQMLYMWKNEKTGLVHCRSMKNIISVLSKWATSFFLMDLIYYNCERLNSYIKGTQWTKPVKRCHIWEIMKKQIWFSVGVYKTDFLLLINGLIMDYWN